MLLCTIVDVYRVSLRWKRFVEIKWRVRVWRKNSRTFRRREERQKNEESSITNVSDIFYFVFILSHYSHLPPSTCPKSLILYGHYCCCLRIIKHKFIYNSIHIYHHSISFSWSTLEKLNRCSLCWFIIILCVIVLEDFVSRKTISVLSVNFRCVILVIYFMRARLKIYCFSLFDIRYVFRCEKIMTRIPIVRIISSNSLSSLTQLFAWSVWEKS